MFPAGQVGFVGKTCFGIAYILWVNVGCQSPGLLIWYLSLNFTATKTGRKNTEEHVPNIQRI